MIIIDTTERFGLSDIEHLAATQLSSLLLDQNYVQIYRHVVQGSLVAPDFLRARRAVRTLCDPERSVLELFGLGVWTDIPPELSQLSRALDEAKLIEFDETRRMWRTSGWVVVPALDGLVMTGIPPSYGTSSTIGASAYIGHDSLMLAGALGDPRGRRILDLGCGSGIQGLLAARGADEVVLTDIDEFSLRMTRLNAAINHISHPISIRQGSLYTPVDGETFDTILVLPPYVPRVPGSATSPTVDGGPDGLEFIRPLLRSAAAHLAVDGELLATCQLFCNDDGPLLAAELGRLCPDLDVRISASNWHPLQPYALELASRLNAHGATDATATLLERYVTSLRSSGATGVCTADIRARRRGDAPRRPPRVVGAIPGVRGTTVPKPRGVDSIVSMGELAAVEHEGSQIVLNPPSAALLQATDGSSSIEDIAVAAWKLSRSSIGQSRLADLLDQAIERFIEMERLGVISLEPN